MVQPTLLEAPPTAAEVKALEAENERLNRVIDQIVAECEAMFRLLPENKKLFVEYQLSERLRAIREILKREGLR